MMGKFGVRGPILGVLAAGAFAAVVAVASAPRADSVKTTVDACSDATAILAGSRGGDHERVWAAIARAMKKDNRKFQIVDQFERNVTERAAFEQWEVKNPTRGGPETVYVAHCGHGATCNQVAQMMAAEFPQVTAPIVHCGDVSNMLANPSPAPKF